MSADKQQRNKEINRRDVLSYLKRAFSRAISNNKTLSSQKATRTVKNSTVYYTERYTLECDFAYLVNEIAMAPMYIVPKYISDANELITKIEERNKKAAVA